MTVMLCGIINSTGLNSILTFISIALSIWALCTAKSTREKLESYNANLKTDAFLIYVGDFHKLNKSFQLEVLKLKGDIANWDKAGAGTKIIKSIVEAKTEVNEYIETIPLSDELKKEFKNLDGLIAEFSRKQPSIEALNDIMTQIDALDQKLKKASETMKVNLFSVK